MTDAEIEPQEHPMNWPAEELLDHKWEPPPDDWLEHSAWMPGQCAYRASVLDEPCGVHLLAQRHLR